MSSRRRVLALAAGLLLIAQIPLLNMSSPAMALVPPNAPNEFAIAPGEGEVSMVWSTPSAGFISDPDVTGYRIYRGPTSSTTSLLITIDGGSGGAYKDSSPSNGNTYCYRMTALVGAVEGTSTATKCVTPHSFGASIVKKEASQYSSASIPYARDPIIPVGRAEDFLQFTFNLPSAGDFDLMVYGKDDQPAPVEVRVHLDGRLAGSISFPTGDDEFHERSFDLPPLAAGSHTVRLTFINDASGGPGDDRNFYLRWIRVPGVLTLTLTTNKQNFVIGDELVASGTVSSVRPGKNVEIRLIDPKGTQHVFASIAPSANGDYSSFVANFAQGDLFGIWTIKVQYSGVSIEKTIRVALHVQKVAVIPVFYKDASQPVTPLSELIQKAQSVTDYFLVQSRDAEFFVFSFVPNNWMQLLHDKDYYDFDGSTDIALLEAINLQDDAIPTARTVAGLQESDYSTILTIVDDPTLRSTTDKIHHRSISIDSKPNSLTYGIWAHELGHAIYGFPDFYAEAGRDTSGELGPWDLMAQGDDIFDSSGNPLPPAPISSYVREQVGWAKYQTIGTTEFGTYDVPQLVSVPYGGDELRYQIGSQTACASDYIFETREGSTTDPRGVEGYPRGVEVYLVQPPITSGSLTEKVYAVPNGTPVTLTTFTDERLVTLPPGSSLTDESRGVRFSSSGAGSDLKIRIEPTQSFGRTVIVACSVFSFISSSGAGSGAFGNPDIDLHAYSPDGSHVGQDYVTNSYEVGIPGASSSGNILGGGPEWISLPDDSPAYFQLIPRGFKDLLDELDLDPDDVTITSVFQAIHYNDDGTKTTSKVMEIPVLVEGSTPLSVPAVLDVNPNVLNLKSSGKYLTAFIELENGFETKEIDKSSIKLVSIDDIRLSNPISAELSPSNLADHNGDGIADLMIKFNRSAVISAIKATGASTNDSVYIRIEGTLNEKLPFDGTDFIRLLQ